MSEYKKMILNLLNEVKNHVDSLTSDDERVDALIETADIVSAMLADTEMIPVLQEEEIATIHGELITVLPVHRQELKSERIQSAYGGDKLALHYRVYSVGVDPLDAILNLGQKLGWGVLDAFTVTKTDDEYAWFYWPLYKARVILEDALRDVGLDKQDTLRKERASRQPK